MIPAILIYKPGGPGRSLDAGMAPNRLQRLADFHPKP